jgi:voltage-gated potassium channel
MKSTNSCSQNQTLVFNHIFVLISAKQMLVQMFSRYSNWRFLQLAIFLMFIWIIFPFISDKWIIQIITQLFILNSILVTLSSSKKETGLKKTMWLLWAIGAIASLIAISPVSRELMIVSLHIESGFHFIIMILFIAIILAGVFRSQSITLDSIFAAFVGYLLLAFAFGLLYRMIFFWSPESFKGAIGTKFLFGDLLYFSLVTIATLGYGDILPVTSTARTIAVLEAVLGQFYVAVIVAVLVGMFISQKIESNAQDKELQ